MKKLMHAILVLLFLIYESNTPASDKQQKNNRNLSWITGNNTVTAKTPKDSLNQNTLRARAENQPDSESESGSVIDDNDNNTSSNVFGNLGINTQRKNSSKSASSSNTPKSKSRLPSLNIDEITPIYLPKQISSDFDNIPKRLQEEIGYLDNFLSSISQIFSDKNVEKRYWHFYELDKKLLDFERMIKSLQEDSKDLANYKDIRQKPEGLLKNIITEVYQSHQQAVDLLSVDFFAKENNALHKLQDFLPDDISIEASPLDRLMHVIDPHRRLIKLLEKKETPKEITDKIREEISYDTITIPNFKSNYEKLSKAVLQNLSYIWFANLRLTNDFVGVSFPLPSHSEPLYYIIQLCIEIHQEIVAQYKEDLEMIKESYINILNFIKNRFEKTPGLLKIYWSIEQPFFATFTLNSDNISERIKILHTYQEKLKPKENTAAKA